MATPNYKPVKDEIGKTVKIHADDLVKVDGMAVFRRVTYEGKIYLQFYDNDRQRSICRGSRFVEIPLDVIVNLLDPQQESPNVEQTTQDATTDISISDSGEKPFE